jgi:hypothetical protein
MSFQSTSCTYLLRSPYFGIIPQPDYISICQPYIYLDSSLISPTILSQHTFRWAQISGSPCTIIGSDSNLSAVYAKPTTTSNVDDKIFRLYVDERFLYAKNYDTNVYATPIEFVINGLSTSVKSESFLFTNGQQVIDTQMYFMPSLSGINDPQNSLNGTSMLLMWKSPSVNKSPAIITTTVLQENSTGTFVDVLIVNGYYSQFVYPVINNNASYRVLTKYNENNVITYALGSTAKLVLSGNRLVSDERLNGAINTSNKNEYQVTKTSRSLLTLNTQNSINEQVEHNTTVINTSIRNEYVKGMTSRSLEIITGPTENCSVQLTSSSRNEYKTTYTLLTRASIGL